MTNRAESSGAALSLLIVFVMVLGGLLAFALSVAPAAHAAACDQTSSQISGNWVINTAQVCPGIVYTIDGNIYINSPGSLTLQNGGIIFAEDQVLAHRYSLFVNGSAFLTLDGSFITTETNLVQPWLPLNVIVTGALNMKNGAALEFPGTLQFNSGSSLNMTSSRITSGSGPSFTGVWGDSANITMAGTTAYLFKSSIENLYNNGGSIVDIVVSAGSNFYAYDTFIGIGFATGQNQMSLTSGSNAYLYNVTMLTYSGTATQSAFLPDNTGSSVYILRWLHVTVVDATGVPVPGATITSTRSPGTQVAQYPDNGKTTTPTSTTRWYLTRILGLPNTAYNVADSNGNAQIPLWTDTISFASLPNAFSFGSYQESASYLAFAPATGGVSFNPYPDMTVGNNNQHVTLSFASSVICTSGVTKWTGTVSLSGPISVSGTLEIAGAATITSGALYVAQQANACGFIQIDSGASLNFVNSSAWSNYPLVIDVTPGGTLATTQGSSLLLTQAGSPGLLRSEGTAIVSLTDSTVRGNLSLMGARASLIRDTLNGPSLAIHTTSTTTFYDVSLPGVTSLSLASDRGLGTVAFDIRNVTFDQVQTAQLQFSGTQNVQLTNVQLFDPTNTWYLTMISGTATVSRYWWLTVNDVDGTGTLLRQANATIYLWRMDPVTAKRVAVPDAAAGDVYFTSSIRNPFVAPSGSILYRAFQGTWTQSSQFLNNTYVADGSASPQGTVYNSDSSAQAIVVSNTVMQLAFSSLTPDLTVSLLTVSGGNGNSLFQPISTNNTLTATIHNSAQISVQNVNVAFYSTIVDANGDGYMDQPPGAYASALIAKTTIAVVPKSGSQSVSVYWTPVGSVETSVPISVVVDPPLASPTDGGAIRETNEANNILQTSLTLFTWPDLAITPADVRLQADPVVNNNVPIQVSVHNLGTNAATEASIQLFESGQPVTVPLKFSVSAGSTATQVVTWRPASIGVHNLIVLITTKNDTIRNKDYNFVNNVASLAITVVTQPDLALVQSDFAVTKTAQQGVAFPITVPVHNLGQTAAVNTSVAVYLNGNRSLEWGRTNNVSVLAGSETNVTVQVKGIATPATVRLMIVVDPDNRLNEGSPAQESNNFANLTVNVLPPTGRVYIGAPNNGTVYGPTDTILVQGVVRDISQNGIAGLIVNVVVMQNGQAIAGMTYSQATDSAGAFVIQVPLNGLADGDYTLHVSPASSAVSSSDATVSVHRVVPFLNQLVPILGIPWWLMLVILAAAVAVVIGVTVYFKVYGLGKMVECGECGAFIPEDATTCPKCGVEFEKDMAKCSNCQAWIPVDVKQCPECGVEFATGQVEMADYQEKMRLQYDEVVQKFKEEASRQLGRALSDKEFQDWWRKQPTFVTFEDWLREEEEMRKMGSKPCPVCGTLNSVTATVCHKCGSLLKEAPRPPTGGAGGSPPASRTTVQAAQAPSQPQAPPPGGAQGASAGQDTIPRRVIRKPLQTQPVVQKRIIKRPMGEGQQGDSTEGGEGQSGDEKQEDEL